MASTSPNEASFHGRDGSSLGRAEKRLRSAGNDDDSDGGIALPPEVWARVLECESALSFSDHLYLLLDIDLFI